MTACFAYQVKERLGVEYEKHRAQYRTLGNAHDDDDDDGDDDDDDNDDDDDDVGLNVLEYRLTY